ncbi:hypothetical protein [Exiguobacterium sp. s141]|uniref:hypothetical protein n=1 Tax=Exiguobacterium sp. s141 TaxID=2751240 RepID=UPI002036B295|nr:hypothetical protein [Exiguobacterium sp. s141]
MNRQRFVKHLLRQDDASIGLIGLILFFHRDWHGVRPVRDPRGIHRLNHACGHPRCAAVETIDGTRSRLVFADFLHLVRDLHQSRSRVIVNALFFVLIVWGVLSKWIVGRVGGRMYGLTRVQANEAGFSLAPRGEFSILFTALSNGAINLFVGLYIFVSAIVSIVLFRFSEILANKTEEKLEKVLPDETKNKEDQ